MDAYDRSNHGEEDPLFSGEREAEEYLSQFDGPSLDFRDQVTEAQDDLWSLRQTMPARPIGTDDAHQPPARFYLPKLAEARALLCEAEEIAKSEIPANLQEEARQYIRRHGPGWYDLAEAEPEMRRFWQVWIARDLIEGLINDLANEGWPQPAPALRLVKQRRG